MLLLLEEYRRSRRPVALLRKQHPGIPRVVVEVAHTGNGVVGIAQHAAVIARIR